VSRSVFVGGTGLILVSTAERTRGQNLDGGSRQSRTQNERRARPGEAVKRSSARSRVGGLGEKTMSRTTKGEKRAAYETKSGAGCAHRFLFCRVPCRDATTGVQFRAGWPKAVDDKRSTANSFRLRCSRVGRDTSVETPMESDSHYKNGTTYLRK
jgi:hypothetical protein